MGCGALSGLAAVDRQCSPAPRASSCPPCVAAMSLLHATWLPAIRSSSSSGQPALLIWADTWRVAQPAGPGMTPALHPFTLASEDLKAWLSERDLLPGASIDA